MNKVSRLLAGAVLLAAILASSVDFTSSQADAPLIHGTAAVNATHSFRVTNQSAQANSAFLDPGINPTPTAPAFFLVSVTMAKGVQGQDNSPVNPTSIFSATDTFHAVAMIQDAPANTNFTSIWYAVNIGSAAQPNTVIDTSQVLTDGTRNIDFSLTPQANSSWPSGIYSVEIDVNGAKGAQIYFTVQ